MKDKSYLKAFLEQIVFNRFNETKLGLITRLKKKKNLLLFLLFHNNITLIIFIELRFKHNLSVSFISKMFHEEALVIDRNIILI